ASHPLLTLPTGSALRRLFFFLALGQNHGQVRRALDPRLEPPASPEPSPGAARAIVGVDLLDDQVAWVQLEVVLGVGHRALDRLHDELRTLLGHEVQLVNRSVRVHTAHGVAHEAQLLRRDRQVLGRRAYIHRVTYLFDSRVKCPRNVRVGANSPSLWPTMFSVM